MRILHLDDHFALQGGIGQYVVSLADLLAKHGHENVVAYRDPTTPPTELVQSYLLAGAPQDQIGALGALIEEQRPDVAMVHHLSRPELVRAVGEWLPTAAYVHGFPIVCPGLAKSFRRGDQVCEQAFGWRCFTTNYLRKCSSARNPATMHRLIRHTRKLRDAYASLDHLVVGSDYMRELLIQNGFVSHRISVLAPHFVWADDLLAYEPPTDPNTVLFAGRLEIEKGLPYLLRALQLLPDSVRLIVAGDGTQRASYEDLAASLGVRKRVDFVGWLDEAEMATLYKRCSLLAFCSTWPEPFGKVGVEALSYGRPVVAFRVGGIPDWLIEGWTGSLVAACDVEGLAESIGGIVADRDLGAEMGRNGQRWVAEALAAEDHVERLMHVFMEAMEREYA